MGPKGISVRDRSVFEEADSITFNVILSGEASETVSVDWFTWNRTAKTFYDFDHSTGTLTFEPGETRKTVTVNLRDDALDEDTETFYLTLQSPVGAIIEDGIAIGRIFDNDDTVWSATLNPAQVTDGPNGYCAPSTTDAAKCAVKDDHAPYGTLSDRTITVGSTQYTVMSLRFGQNTLVRKHHTHLTLDRQLQTAHEEKLVLIIGPHALHVSEVQDASEIPGEPAAGYNYTWNSVTGTPWVIGEDTEVTITSPDI